MPATFELPPIAGMEFDSTTGSVRFVIDPDHPLTVERFEAGMALLKEACISLGVELGPWPGAALAQITLPDEPSSPSLWGPHNFNVPWKFEVGEVVNDPYKMDTGTHNRLGRFDFGRIVFRDSSNRRVTPACEWCWLAGPQLFYDDERTMCAVHAGWCENCEAVTAPEFPVCQRCEPQRDLCANCARYVTEETGTFSDYWDAVVCEGCRPARCSQCSRETMDVYGSGMCERCYYSAEDQEIRLDPIAPFDEPMSDPVYVQPRDTEEFEDDVKAVEELLIPSIAGRENIRACGIEIEGGGSGRALARALYSVGLSQYERQLNYHTQTTFVEDGVRTWTVENDSSVDWEMVSPPLNIADREDVRQLQEAVNVLRAQIKEGVVGLDIRCGLHIHVGAERVGITHAYHLGKVWGYLEDVIFRLGAARWPYHRAVLNGLHYCQPTPKGAKTKLEFGRQMDNNMDRYNALSFQNYIQSFTRRCQCGAVRYDSWDECTCDLGKCTFEFRVFNTSANMHKIHAYMALCQSLVAWATGRDEIDPDSLPEQSYVNRQGNDLQAGHVDAWKERLEFIFTELPLTEGEKRDLLYCVQHSDLNLLGSDVIDALPLNAMEVVA